MGATCGADGIKIWKHNSEQNWVFTNLESYHTRSVRCIAWSKNGMLLASGGFDALGLVWEYNNGVLESTCTLEGHENEIKHIAWSFSGKYICTCSRDKTCWIWEIINQTISLEVEIVAILQGHTQDVKFCKFHPFSDQEYHSCGFDGTLCIWKRKQDDEWICSKKVIISNEGTCWAFDYNPANPEKIITVTSKSEVKLFNVVSGNSTFLPTKHLLSINTVSWSNKNEIVTAGTDNCLGIYNKLRNYLYVPQAHEDD